VLHSSRITASDLFDRSLSFVGGFYSAVCVFNVVNYTTLISKCSEAK
jgi:hypothetical protein